MTTIEKLTAELEEAKLKMKIAKACNLVVDAFLNKDDFKFETSSGTRHLFSESSYFFSCGSMALKAWNVKNYEELYKIVFDVAPTNTKGLRAAVKLIESNDDISCSILNGITLERIV